jgi:uncharacterized protein YicC (UPF0701 family)
MKDFVTELNKEICPVHSKPAQCNNSNEGVEIKACCTEFRVMLQNLLRRLFVAGS